ncbi:2'-5' RNA ligase family protein [Kribbella sancticallisti]
MFDEVRNHWVWRPGWRPGRSFYTWHITFADQPAAVALAAEYQATIDALPGITPVPPRWLHLTMQGVGFADRVQIFDLDGIAEATRARLREVQAFAVDLGPAVIDAESIQLPATPAEPLQRLRDVLRLSISDVWGPSSVPELPELRPHISLGYWNTPAPAAPLRDHLTQAPAPTTTVHITAIDLINLHRDHELYEWTTVTRCPLA